MDFYLTPEGKCSGSCPLRTTASGRQCISCPYDCLNCNILGECLACSQLDDHRYLNIEFSRCVPLIGFFDNLETVALPCPSGCDYCFSDSICVVCIANFKKGPDGVCYSDCLAGTFNNQTFYRC